MSAKYPSFHDLPLRPGDPQYSAWGLWGDEDQLGTLVRSSNIVMISGAINELMQIVRITSLLLLFKRRVQMFVQDRDLA